MLMEGFVAATQLRNHSRRLILSPMLRVHSAAAGLFVDRHTGSSMCWVIGKQGRIADGSRCGVASADTIRRTFTVTVWVGIIPLTFRCEKEKLERHRSNAVLPSR